jgi:hypothetical protein
MEGRSFANWAVVVMLLPSLVKSACCARQTPDQMIYMVNQTDKPPEQTVQREGCFSGSRQGIDNKYKKDKKDKKQKKCHRRRARGRTHTHHPRSLKRSHAGSSAIQVALTFLVALPWPYVQVTGCCPRAKGERR